MLDADALVEVTVPRALRLPGHADVAVRYAELAPDDVVPHDGMRVTTPVRTGFDLARGRPWEEAVVAVDAVLHACDLSAQAIAGYAGDGRMGWHGARNVAGVLAIASAASESPMESRLRLVLLRAGLPEPVVQHRVWDARGHFVARLDLAYVEARLGIEYDGAGHWDPAAVRRDLRRQNALRALGWSLLRFTADDVLRSPDRLVALVRASAPFPNPALVGASRSARSVEVASVPAAVNARRA